MGIGRMCCHAEVVQWARTMVVSHSFGDFLRVANEGGFLGFLLPIGPPGASRLASDMGAGRPQNATSSALW